MALVHALLTEFDEDLKEEEVSYCVIDLCKLADFYGKIQSKDRMVSRIEFNPEDHKYLLKHLPGGNLTLDGAALWGAEVIVNERLNRNNVLAYDGMGQRHFKHWYRDPEEKYRKLLRRYVLCKRQYEYFRKRYDRFPTLSSDHENERFKSQLAAFKEQLRSIEEDMPNRAAVIREQEGADMSFGNWRGSIGYQDSWIDKPWLDFGIGQSENKDREHPQGYNVTITSGTSTNNNVTYVIAGSGLTERAQRNVASGALIGAGTPFCKKCKRGKEDSRLNSDNCYACDGYRVSYPKEKCFP